MAGARKRPAYDYHETAPLYTAEEVVDDSQDDEIDVVNVQSEDAEIEDYEGEVDDEPGFYVEVMEQMPDLKKAKRDSYLSRKLEKVTKITECITARKVNLVGLGTHVMVGTSNKTLNESGLEKAMKDSTGPNSHLGQISMEALVEGMMMPSAYDGRYAMLGTSIMFNTLKTNMRDLKSDIIEQTATTTSEPRFDAIDLNIANVPYCQKNYVVHSQGVFENADLNFIFSQLVFRNTAKLLNKTKQFLKAYFVIACRPRCMIWRYSLRRAGNSNRKAILNLPAYVVQNILNLLIDATGIGSGDKLFHQLDRRTPFFQSLGEDDSLREQRYYEICKLKDPLTDFFRNAITDTLNEIREMPFCWHTGKMISPLRGRMKGSTCVLWREYEEYLKVEQEVPSESNMIARKNFEQRLCAVLIRTGHTIR